jgi:transcriptional regulator with XRE-family HTH domain
LKQLKVEEGQSLAFARRLRDAMTERGHVSAGARSGVDIASLARAAGISYEMARRYAEGAAIPRPNKLEAIARWLGVDPGFLAWGANESEPINLQTLETCLTAIAEAQRRTGRTLTTEKAAHLVALLYQEAIAGRHPVQETVDLLLKV